MRFAIVDATREEARPGLVGTCPACESPVVAKCGERRVWHWAHRGTRVCDARWESEGEWHRAWKERFPLNWQEVVHRADNGERHIADIKTEHGWVLEFQSSYIQPEERRSRENFYRKMVWIVSGTRRIRDRQQFSKAWERGISVGNNSPVRQMVADECALLKEWGQGAPFVFVDFAEEDQGLWWLLRGNDNGSIYVAHFTIPAFIEVHRVGAFDPLAVELVNLITNYEARTRARPHHGLPLPLMHRARFRRRF